MGKAPRGRAVVFRVVGFLPIAASAFLLCCASSAVATTPPLPIDPAEIVAAHNKYRAQVGVPPLRWSGRLADGAQQWAEEIAALSEMRHSGTSGVGENLAVWWGSRPSLSQLIGMWGDEKSEFHPGRFPNVSVTGNWKSVAHYTQMIWRDTTEVGCGSASNAAKVFFVCWYSPQGNFLGQIPY